MLVYTLSHAGVFEDGDQYNEYNDGTEQHSCHDTLDRLFRVDTRVIVADVGCRLRRVGRAELVDRRNVR